MTIDRFRDFVQTLTRMVEAGGDIEARMFEEAQPLLGRLVTHDDWLPDEWAQPRTERYQQYLLHCDPLERFSIVSFVWGPGQRTPIHDHTVWGMIGVLRGAEQCEEFDRDPSSGLVSAGTHRVLPGQIDTVSPRSGDIHRVANARTDGASVSIHVYGANIGAVRRHAYDASGGMQTFVSGYSNELIPNIWDRSAEAG